MTGWNAPIGEIDPQIAASDKSYMVLTSVHNVAFVDKAGKLLTTDKNGNPLPYANPTPDLSFFSWLLKIINTPGVLNLPGSWGTKKNADGSLYYGLDEVYDTRAIWDSYRNRFWIVAQGRNDHARNGTDEEKRYRRDKLLIAVSVDSDPRDGFYYYWGDALPGDGGCTPADASCPPGYKPGYGADYPALGISPHAFLDAELAGNITVHEGYDVVNVVRADKLVAGTCDQQCSWSYWDIPAVDGKGDDGRGIIEKVLEPAVQHGPSPFNGQYLLGTAGNQTLALYAFQPDDPFPPQLYQAKVDLKYPFARAIDVPQRPNADNSSPSPVNVGSNMFLGHVMRAVYRDGQLYGVGLDCTTWPGQPSCITSIDLWQVDLIQHSLSIDRPFGERGPGDGPNDVVAYGWPAMDVNNAGTIVIGYQRTGQTVFPEARFTVRFANDSDNRPSYVLKKGTYPLGVPGATNAAGRLDISGAAVDGFDDNAVWLIQAYAYKYGPANGAYQYVVGKVFGGLYPDVFVVRPRIIPREPLLRPGDPMELTAQVGNQGDGAAPAVRVTASLVPPRRAHQAAKARARPLHTTSIGTLRPGRTSSLRIHLTIPRRLSTGRYQLKLVVSTTVRREYDKSNNIVNAGNLTVHG
jgi:hypothetical protein